MGEPCIACKEKPNCDREWYMSGLCRDCLTISRGPTCKSCFNSPLYCVCNEGEVASEKSN